MKIYWIYTSLTVHLLMTMLFQQFIEHDCYTLSEKKFQNTLLYTCIQYTKLCLVSVILAYKEI